MTEMLAAGEEYMQPFPFHRLTDVLVALDRWAVYDKFLLCMPKLRENGENTSICGVVT